MSKYLVTDRIAPCDGCGTTSTDYYVQRGPVWLCSVCERELVEVMRAYIAAAEMETAP